MNQSQSADVANPNVRINVVGDGTIIDILSARASRLGVELQVNSATAKASDVVWQSAAKTLSSTTLIDAPQTGNTQAAFVTLVTGFGPPYQGEVHLPLLRLTDPGRDDSLAELMPPANGTDSLPDVFTLSCRAMGFTPVVLAGAAQGFAVRAANALMIEAMALLGEGVSPQAIEASASQAGLPQAPLLMLDLMGLKVLDDLLHAELHAHDAHHHDHDHEHHHEHHHENDSHAHGASSELMPESAVYVLEKMAHGFDRMGAAGGYGFYDHEEDGSAELWDGLAVFARGAKPLPEADIADRLLFRVAIEAQNCVREGLLDKQDADRAAHSAGLFPPTEGGISGWVARQGETSFIDRAKQLAESYGKRFEVRA